VQIQALTAVFELRRIAMMVSSVAPLKVEVLKTAAAATIKAVVSTGIMN